MGALKELVDKINNLTGESYSLMSATDAYDHYHLLNSEGKTIGVVYKSEWQMGKILSTMLTMCEQASVHGRTNKPVRLPATLNIAIDLSHVQRAAEQVASENVEPLSSVYDPHANGDNGR